ncbi:MAG TPA: hypothetical protein V6C95_05260 [Coleofasciculaceae cyanobacterium]
MERPLVFRPFYSTKSMENSTDFRTYRSRPDCHLKLEQLVIDAHLQQWTQRNHAITAMELKHQYCPSVSDEKICVADWRDDSLEIFWV